MCHDGAMAVERTDVQSLVSALFTLIDGIERASRLSRGATSLRLLQVVAALQPARPSAPARQQQVHPSLVTRQLQDLVDMGYVDMRVDPADGRSR
jgi:DNA-binding MarR family transcriptional regulator